MSDLRNAAQQALEALESGDWYIDQLEMIVHSSDDTGTHEERAKVQAAITALRAALAEPEQPVGEIIEMDDGSLVPVWCDGTPAAGTELFAGPAPRRPVPHPDYLCRSDWRCQYAIDSGAEGMGHCPKGRCVMAEPANMAIPVEYQYHYPDGHWRCSNGESINGMRPDASRPLYAKPYSMPLTDEEIKEIAERLDQQGNSLRQFARAIERAHGIGEQHE